MKDPYEALRVSRDASAEEIKRAYRKLAKKLHPDLNPGNSKIEQQFKEVSQAYDILGDPERRKRFDRGEINASGQETGWQGGFYRTHAASGARSKYRHFDFGGDINVEDIISDLFGGRGRGRRARRRGDDVSYTAPIGFLDAAVGTTKRIRLADGKALEMTIPPRPADGPTLRRKGQGRPGQGGGAPGDAYVVVHIEPHPYFTRKAKDVHLELPVTLKEAVLGATVTVPTVHGKVSMKIPAGSNSGTTLRLRAKGIRDRKNRVFGDQYVRLKVELPDKPDIELKDFVKRWSKGNAYDPRRKAGMT
ncbi:MAG: DnaJ C-terminal domain-containing protein [Kiloniellaceae bacterium]